MKKIGKNGEIKKSKIEKTTFMNNYVKMGVEAMQGAGNEVLAIGKRT